MSWSDHIALSVRKAWNTRSEPESMRILAGAFWRLSLVSAASIVAGFALFGGSLFFSATGGPGEPTLVTGTGVTLNRTDLQAILKELDARAERYESVKINRPSIADPSR